MIGNVEGLELLEAITQRVLLGENLNVAAEIAEVQKRCLAEPSAREQPAEDVNAVATGELLYGRRVISELVLGFEERRGKPLTKLPDENAVRGVDVVREGVPSTLASGVGLGATRSDEPLFAAHATYLPIVALRA
jgi:hypothetical protein